MSDITLRLGILLLVGIGAWLLVWVGKRFVATQRERALHAAPLFPQTPVDEKSMTPVRILAFSSPDCHQCHQLQAPALQRLLAARGEQVSVVEVDATSEHELTQTYHVLTVPSTVVLDANGKAHAVNYGFTPTPRLLKQVDDLLATRTFSQSSPSFFLSTSAV